MNLLKETNELLANHGKTGADVRWVQFGSYRENGFHCTWDEFVAAANFDYDNGYGGAEVCIGLKVVGDDWWLERGEYDGAEWWEFKTRPTKPAMRRTPVERDLRED